MVKRKYEVHALDQNGDVWIVGTDLKESAEHLAETFREQGYHDIRIIENT